MNEIQTIQSKIYEIRGQRVMLDSDLADLYMVETKNLKRAVRNNMERFPADFMFELTKEEYETLRCNFFTSNVRGGNRYLPFAFTRAQLDAISTALSELQAKEPRKRERNPIGFIKPEKKAENTPPQSD